MALLYAGIALLAFIAYRLCHKLPHWLQLLVGIGVFVLLTGAVVAYQRRGADDPYIDAASLYEESAE